MVDTLRIVINSSTSAFRSTAVTNATVSSDGASSSVPPSTASLQSPLLIRTKMLYNFCNLRLASSLQIPEEQWRILKFILFGVTFTMFFCFADLYATYHLDPKVIVKNATVCVLLHATTNPEEALDICGTSSFEINGIWTVYALVLYGGIFGTIPLLIFGFKRLRRRVIKEILKLLPSREVAFTSDVDYDGERSGEHKHKSNELSDIGDEMFVDKNIENTHNPINET